MLEPMSDEMSKDVSEYTSDRMLARAGTKLSEPPWIPHNNADLMNLSEYSSDRMQDNS